MSAGTVSLGPVRGIRRAKDTGFTVFLWTCAVLALVPLTWIAIYVVSKGIGALSWNFFTKVPAGPLNPQEGGIVQSFVGTGLIVGIATAIAVPLGILSGIYLAEYGKGRTASGIRLVAYVLLSTPSIVAGAFIWALVVVALGNFSALAGGLSLVVLMWPIVAIASEAVLRLAPDLRHHDNPDSYFAPHDWRSLDADDADLGGTNPLPLDVTGVGGSAALLLALGKDGRAYLIDRNRLGGIGGSLVAIRRFRWEPVEG